MVSGLSVVSKSNLGHHGSSEESSSHSVINTVRSSPRGLNESELIGEEEIYEARLTSILWYLSDLNLLICFFDFFSTLSLRTGRTAMISN